MKKIYFILFLMVSISSLSQVKSFGGDLYGIKSKRITFTLKPMLNTNYLTNIVDKLDDVPSTDSSDANPSDTGNEPSIGSPSVQDVGDDLNIGDDSDMSGSTIDNGDSGRTLGDDLLNLGSYDLKVKLSLGKNIMIVNQIIVNGSSVSGYRYTSGIVITF